ncbi:MAG: aldo/keto reductase [Spirochaetaceae bacterium]|jgi:predicted aldo/keto reductase-like oxidoreductase|nr:aldo/keto reductase [Spirochaetaceae bacterium]
MKKVRLGKTGLMVSRVALGGIPIMRVPKAEAAELVREAIGLGINFIDTAHVYSDSEEKIGEGIKGIRREDLVIASKSPANDKKAFNEHLETSLKRLGVDYIDIYQLHNIGSGARRDAVLAPGGAYEGLVEAVRAGKVRFPAFSSHSLPIVLELAKSGKFSVLQFPFNYIDYEAEKDLIPLAKELDMGFIAMKPMGGGLLDNAGLSFRYLLQYDSVVPDPGIERIEEIREIAAIVEKNEPLSGEDRKEIEKLRAEFGPSWCHRCDYCQPCPQGIPISSALGAKSSIKRFSPARWRELIGPALESARNCLECGECVKRCPYHLEIPKLLKESIAFWDDLNSGAA